MLVTASKRQHRWTRDNYMARMDAKVAQTVSKPNLAQDVQLKMTSRSLDRGKLVTSRQVELAKCPIQELSEQLQTRKDEIWIERAHTSDLLKPIMPKIIFDENGVDITGQNKPSPISSTNVSPRGKKVSNKTPNNVEIDAKTEIRMKRLESVKERLHREKLEIMKRKRAFIANELISAEREPMTMKQRQLLNNIGALLEPTVLPEITPPSKHRTGSGNFHRPPLPVLMTGGISFLVLSGAERKLNRFIQLNALEDQVNRDKMYTWLGLDSQDVLDSMKAAAHDDDDDDDSDINI